MSYILASIVSSFSGGGRGGDEASKSSSITYSHTKDTNIVSTTTLATNIQQQQQPIIANHTIHGDEIMDFPTLLNAAKAAKAEAQTSSGSNVIGLIPPSSPAPPASTTLSTGNVDTSATFYCKKYYNSHNEQQRRHLSSLIEQTKLLIDTTTQESYTNTNLDTKATKTTKNIFSYYVPEPYYDDADLTPLDADDHNSNNGANEDELLLDQHRDDDTIVIGNSTSRDRVITYITPNHSKNSHSSRRNENDTIEINTSTEKLATATKYNMDCYSNSNSSTMDHCSDNRDEEDEHHGSNNEDEDDTSTSEEEDEVTGDETTTTTNFDEINSEAAVNNDDPPTSAKKSRMVQRSMMLPTSNSMQDPPGTEASVLYAATSWTKQRSHDNDSSDDAQHDDDDEAPSTADPSTTTSIASEQDNQVVKKDADEVNSHDPNDDPQEMMDDVRDDDVVSVGLRTKDADGATGFQEEELDQRSQMDDEKLDVTNVGVSNNNTTNSKNASSSYNDEIMIPLENKKKAIYSFYESSYSYSNNYNEPEEEGVEQEYEAWEDEHNDEEEPVQLEQVIQHDEDDDDGDKDESSESSQFDAAADMEEDNESYENDCTAPIPFQNSNDNTNKLYDGDDDSDIEISCHDSSTITMVVSNCNSSPNEEQMNMDNRSVTNRNPSATKEDAVTNVVVDLDNDEEADTLTNVADGLDNDDDEVVSPPDETVNQQRLADILIQTIDDPPVLENKDCDGNAMDSEEINKHSSFDSNGCSGRSCSGDDSNSSGTNGNIKVSNDEVVVPADDIHEDSNHANTNNNDLRDLDTQLTMPGTMEEASTDITNNDVVETVIAPAGDGKTGETDNSLLMERAEAPSLVSTTLDQFNHDAVIEEDNDAINEGTLFRNTSSIVSASTSSVNNDNSNENDFYEMSEDNDVDLESDIAPISGIVEQVFEKIISYNDGATPLFLAIEDCDWINVEKICYKDPYQASIWVMLTGSAGGSECDDGEGVGITKNFNDSQNENNNNDKNIVNRIEPQPAALHYNTWSLWKRLPLHEIVRRHPPARTVSIIVQAYPSACEAMTDLGEIPLHIAIECGANRDVIHILALSYWRGIYHRDHMGRTPYEILIGTERQLEIQNYYSVASTLQLSMDIYNEIQYEHDRATVAIQTENQQLLGKIAKQHMNDIQCEKDKQDKLVKDISKLQTTIRQQNIYIEESQNLSIEYDKKIHLLQEELYKGKLERIDYEKLAIQRYGQLNEYNGLLRKQQEDKINKLNENINELHTIISRITSFNRNTMRQHIDTSTHTILSAVQQFQLLSSKLHKHTNELDGMLNERGIVPLEIFDDDEDDTVVAVQKANLSLSRFLLDQDDQNLNINSKQHISCFGGKNNSSIGCSISSKHDANEQPTPTDKFSFDLKQYDSESNDDDGTIDSNVNESSDDDEDSADNGNNGGETDILDEQSKIYSACNAEKRVFRIIEEVNEDEDDENKGEIDENAAKKEKANEYDDDDEDEEEEQEQEQEGNLMVFDKEESEVDEVDFANNDALLRALSSWEEESEDKFERKFSSASTDNL